MKHLRRYKTQSVHSAGDTIRKQNTSMSKTGLIRQFNIQKNTQMADIFPIHVTYRLFFSVYQRTRSWRSTQAKGNWSGEGERQTERSWPPPPPPPPPPLPAFSFIPSSRPFTSLRSTFPSPQHPPLVLLLYTSPFPLLIDTWNFYIIVGFFLRQTEKETLTHILSWKKEREREGDRDTQRDREGGRDTVS